MDDTSSTYRRWLPVVLTAGIGIIASLVLFQVISEYERTAFTTEFERRAEHQVSMIQAVLDNHMRFIDGLTALYAASKKVERSEFQEFIQATKFYKLSSDHVIAWVPRLSQADRPDYEGAARNDGISDFLFTEQTADGTLTPALVRQMYYPVYYVGVESPHRKILGFDLGSDKQSLAILERARDTGTLIVSQNFELPALKKGVRVFMIARPIYKKGAPTDTIEQRRVNLKGYITAFHDVTVIVNNALKNQFTAGLHFLVREETIPPEKGNLSFHVSRTESTPQKQENLHLPDNNKLTFMIELHGLKWMIDFWPAASLHEMQRGWAQWLSLISGILMTVSACALISLFIFKRAEIIKTKRLIEISEAKYRALLNQAPDAIFMTTLDAKMIEVNVKCEKLFGYPREELLIKTIEDLHPKSEWARLKTAFRGIIINGAGEVLNSTILCKNGGIIPVDVSGKTLKLGDETYVQAIIRDISARKELEENLLQVQKLSALAHMISGIAHELNNMLVPILSLTSVTARRLPEEDRDRSRLNKVLEAAQRASETVKKLVAFTRWGDPKLENILVTPFMEETVKELFSTIPASIMVDIEIKKCNAVVQGDRSQLKNALYNIVDNAADAMEGGNGKLALKIEVIEHAEDNRGFEHHIEPGLYVRLVFKDDGIGMDADTIAKVFDPFFTTKPVGKGTGLGLSTAYGIITQHGGMINVKSTLGQGSTVEVYLPVFEMKKD